MIVGIDLGGTNDNVTVLDSSGRFLIDDLVETPSRVGEGPPATLDALEKAFENALAAVGAKRDDATAVGLGTPGPASAAGVLSSRGSTNFPERAWWNFDIRGALEERLRIPVAYVNDCNAAAIYAHRAYFGDRSGSTSSASLIVGTGLGGGIVVDGTVHAGASGQAAELGHVRIDLEGLLGPGQEPPVCNCGRVGDAESIASLGGLGRSLLPYWLTRFPGHELASMPILDAAKALRSFGERGDPLARAAFAQQAKAIGRLCTIIADVIDPDVYFIGGGVIEAAAEFREWFIESIRESLDVRDEQSREVALVPDGDMAGARGAAFVAAMQ